MQRQIQVHVHVKCSCIDINPSDPSQRVSHFSLHCITHGLMQWGMTDPASGHKFTSPEPLGGKKERHKKRERKGGTRLLHALLESEMDHG